MLVIVAAVEMLIRICCYSLDVCILTAGGLINCSGVCMTGGALFLTTVGNHESIWQGSTSLYQGRDSGGECGLSAELVSSISPD